MELKLHDFKLPLGHPTLLALFLAAAYAVIAALELRRSVVLALWLPSAMWSRGSRSSPALGPAVSILDSHLLGWDLKDAIVLHDTLSVSQLAELKDYYASFRDLHVPTAVIVLGGVALWAAWPRPFRKRMALLFLLPVASVAMEVLEGRMILRVLTGISSILEGGGGGPESVEADDALQRAAWMGGSVYTPLKFMLGWITFAVIMAGFSMRVVASAPEEEDRWAWLYRSRRQHWRQLKAAEDAARTAEAQQWAAQHNAKVSNAAQAQEADGAEEQRAACCGS